MNTYKALVKITETVHKTSYVEVQAKDAQKAKLQLEVMYGKNNLISHPTLVK
jgi:hypothetical protein